jgi:hypothetical protein
MEGRRKKKKKPRRKKNKNGQTKAKTKINRESNCGTPDNEYHFYPVL